jgi:Lrp/AsnC family transcriptional regulator, leucine-responsive regulatory protein
MGQSRILDQIDKRILHELMSNGRISNADLAERVGLSASPCWQRVRRLEQDGFIVGYTTVLNQERLGAGEIVIVEVTLERHDDEILGEFGRALANIPECWKSISPQESTIICSKSP